MNRETTVMGFFPALEAGYEPKNYSFYKEDVPTGNYLAKLDFMLWSKTFMAINCFFTIKDSGKKISLSVYKKPGEDDLLEKVKAVRIKLIEEKQLKKEKILLPINEKEIPFDIPISWRWCRLGDIISFGPSNGYSPKESKTGTGIKCLTLTATTSGVFKEEFYKLVDEIVPLDSYLWLKDGDILIQRGNSIDYVGIAALYEGEPNNFIYPDLMIKIRLPKLIDAKFIHQVLVSPFCRKYFSSNAFGAQKSMPKINQGVILNTLIPLPPFQEQKRIVEKLEKVMNFCEEIAESIKQSKKENERLIKFY